MAFLIVEDNFEGIQSTDELNETTGNKDYYIQGVFLQAEQKNRNGRIYPSAILEREVERYTKEYINNNRSIGELNHPECKVYNDFQILTPNGWKEFVDINVGDEVLTMDDNECLVIDNVIKKTNEDNYKGIAYKIKGRNIDTTVTPKHRFYLRGRSDQGSKLIVATAEDIFNNSSFFNKCRIIKNVGNFDGINKEYVTIPAIENIDNNIKPKYKQEALNDLNINTSLFVKFLGFWLAEGHISTDKYIISITHNEGDVLDSLIELYDQIGFDYNINYQSVEDRDYKKAIVSFSDIRLHSYLSSLGKCYDKFIPNDIKQLHPMFLEELIEWFGKGDGRKDTNGFDYNKGMLLNIFSTSYRLIEDFQECIIKCGYSGNISVVKGEKDLYILNISHDDGIYLDRRFITIDKIKVDAGAYCITTKNGNFYSRDNGKVHLTGNSPSINAERACHFIKELNKVGNDWIGKSKITTEGLGKIVKGLIIDGVQLGVSSRGLGTLTECKEKNANIVNEDFFMSTIDVVSDPSAPAAWVNGIYEGREFYMGDDEQFIEKVKHHIDNESSKIGFSMNEEQIALIHFNNMIKNIYNGK